MSPLLVLHVVISLVAIAAGFVIAYGFVCNRRLAGWNAVFLVTTIATSATGFVLPADRFTPAHAFGIISFVALGVALWARYTKSEVGRWRAVYVASALFAFYLNMFVLIVQMFQKLPVLKALAPTQSEPPFAIAQLALLVAFVVMGTLSLRRYHPASIVAA
ncbi:MAG: hypothetical protein C0478_03335 [Planctomyces sp.]|nr:hypothetical protein [Planctomyces sp.]